MERKIGKGRIVSYAKGKKNYKRGEAEHLYDVPRLTDAEIPTKGLEEK